MRVIPASTQVLLEAQTLCVRDFMRITARVRETGAPISVGFWSDIGDITAPVVDADTGEVTSYDFEGVGGLIAVDAIPMVSNLTVQEVNAAFSHLDDRINELLRTYDLRQAKVTIYRAEFDPDTQRMVEPAAPRFVGFVDGAPIETPAEGGEGSASIRCVSAAQELTKGNPEVRSHEGQQLRQEGDDFFLDVTAAAEINIFWGKAGDARLAAPVDTSVFGG